MSVVSFIIAIANLAITFGIVATILKAVPNLKESRLFVTGVCFAITAIILILHTSVEVFGLDEIYYAITALVASIFYFVAIYYANLSTKPLEVQS